MNPMTKERTPERLESLYGRVEIVTKSGCYVRAEDPEIVHYLYYPGIGTVGGRVLLQIRKFNEYRNAYDSFLDSFDYDAPLAA